MPKIQSTVSSDLLVVAWNDTGGTPSVPILRQGDDTVDVQIRGRTYTPQEISAMILQNLNRMRKAFG